MDARLLWARSVLSPSSRRAWIEIRCAFERVEDACVALLAEGVDRNFFVPNRLLWEHWVALLAEGVDRNRLHYICTMEDEVALLAEGVDRNFVCQE